MGSRGAPMRLNRRDAAGVGLENAVFVAIVGPEHAIEQRRAGGDGRGGEADEGNGDE
jgi:hypothetical protein